MDDKNIQWKNLAIIFVGLIVIWYLFSFISMTGNGAYPHMGGSVNTGLNIGGLLGGLVLLAIKILWILLLIGLLVGVFLEGKKFLNIQSANSFSIEPLINRFNKENYGCPSCNEKLSQDFKFCPNCKESLQNQCTQCGKELLAGWNCCPCCGKENIKGGDKDESMV